MSRTTPRAKLATLAEAERVKRPTVELLVTYLRDATENAEKLSTRLDPIADLDADLADPDGLDDLGGSDAPFADLADALDKVRAAQTAAQSIIELIDQFTSAVDEFIEEAEAWLDESTDRDERADARHAMQAAAETLADIMSELEDNAIDLDTEW